MKQMTKRILLTTSIVLISGCSATSALIDHSNLDVNSKMSDTIFLDPTPQNQKTIYLQVKNTTSEDLKGITTELTKNFTAAGWTVVTDQNKAYNMAQVNVLQAGEAEDPNKVWQFVQSGYGTAATAAVLGGLAGFSASALGASTSSSIGIGAGVGALSWLADSTIKNKIYSVVTDIQVSVKTNNKVDNVQKANLKQGSATVQKQTSKSTGNWLKYQTRIGTVAQKVNLKFPDAKPVIVQQLAQQISGIFVEND